MEWTEVVQTIFTVVIIPLLSILTMYGVQFIKMKCDELRAKSDNELHDKYITMLEQTVSDCVLMTTQTYVDAMKNNKVFDVQAQKEAFELTKTAVLNILTDDAKEYLQSAVGDFDKYLTSLIESQVHINK